MTEKIQAIEMCLQLNNVYEDYPFDDNWTAMRHKENKKTFAFIYKHNGRLQMNVKVLPEVGAALRQQFQSIEAAYHMNKMHWVTVVLDGKLPDEIIRKIISDSFNLTLPKSIVRSYS